MIGEASLMSVTASSEGLSDATALSQVTGLKINAFDVMVTPRYDLINERSLAPGRVVEEPSHWAAVELEQTPQSVNKVAGISDSQH